MSDWKRFQDRVAELEALVVKSGFSIESPARLRDRDTGQAREIDVLVRTGYAGRELLVMLECRRRTRTSDVTWIEQLNSKRDSVGANHVVAISNKELTKPAQLKARQLNIELRTLSEVTAESLLEDVYVLTLVFNKRCTRDAQVVLDCGPLWSEHIARHPEDESLDPTHAPLDEAPSELAEATRDIHAKVLVDERSGCTISVWDFCKAEWPSLFEGLAPGSPPQHRSMALLVPGEPPCIRTQGEPRWYVAHVEVSATVWIENVNLTPSGSFRYEDENHVLLKRLEYDLREAGEEGLLTLDMYPPRPDGMMPFIPRVFQRSPGLPTISLRRDMRIPPQEG